MPYIDKEKIDFRLPYLRDEDGDALVSVRAVKQMMNLATVDNVAPVKEVVNKIREGIRKNAHNPSNRYDFIYEDIYSVLDYVLEEYYAKKDT